MELKKQLNTLIIKLNGYQCDDAEKMKIIIIIIIILELIIPFLLIILVIYIYISMFVSCFLFQLYFCSFLSHAYDFFFSQFPFVFSLV